MRTRREFLKGMGAVLVCGILAGCGGSAGGGAATPSNPSGGDQGGSSDNKPADNAATPDNNVPNLEAYRKEVLRLVNEEREKAGVGALEMDDVKLLDAAQVRAKELTVSFEHTRPDGTHCSTAYKEQGGTKTYIGENIAEGYTSPEKVMAGWMNSEGHRWNILHEKYKKIGIGYYYDKNDTVYKHYWVQMFTD